MTKKNLIEKTVKYLKKMPEDKISEVADFAEFIFQRREEYILRSGAKKLTENSRFYKILEKDENLYTLKDIKEKYK